MQHRDYFEKEVRTVLCVRDLERSRNFYQQTLELVPVWDGGMEGCRFAAAGGAVELRPSGTNLPQGPTTIMLEADNVDDCYSRLAKKPGLHVYEHIADRPYGIRLFQLLDPDENVIVIFSWSRDVMEYQHGWQPTVPGMFRGEYRAVAYVDVTDYEQSLAFYRDILRLRACYTWDYGTKDWGHKFVIGSGDGTLEVLCRKDPMPQGNETLMFEAQDADSCFEAIMKKAGPLVQVLQEPCGCKDGTRAFTLLDPHGNHVVIYSEQRR